MFKPVILATVVAASFSAQAADAQPTNSELLELLKQQQAEIEVLKEQITEADTKINATADAVESGMSAGSATWAEKTTIGGYGEHHFNHFEDKDDQVDAHRFVMFMSHQFSDNIRLFSEVELEHGLTVDTDDGSGPGEVELEQAYIEWDYTAGHSVQIGQFLIPVGIINETHEPDTFYGTERNLVEKNIVPATWWETGLLFNGEIQPGLAYSLGIHSGLSTDDGGKIRDGRQKSAKATAEDLAYTGRLKYTAIAGLELAATIQLQKNITQGDVESADALLTELHAIYNTGPFTVRALWANWDIDGEGFEANGRDEQSGWYVEPSYKVSEKLGLFARYSEYNNNAGDASSVDNEIWEYGLNYWINPRVVLKADYSDYVTENNGSADNDAFNLGVGWSF